MVSTARFVFGLAVAGLLASGLAHAQDSFGIERGTGRIICTDDADTRAAKSDDPSYARAAAWDARVFGDVGTPCYAPLTDLDVGVWKQSAPFMGADAEGRQADFRIYVLHDTYNWKIGSTVEIENDGRPADPQNIFAAPNFNERFCGANSAFAFGMSSSEGATASNHATSRARSKTVAEALKLVRDNCEAGRIPIIFGVNLGEHEDDPTCRDKLCSAAQRRVIIISADEITVGVDLADALASGIREQRVFRGLDVDKYDLFEIESY